MAVAEIMDRTGPRRLLALDGGGIRGLITVEVLAEIERIFQGDRGDDFVLADAFDYVALVNPDAFVDPGWLAPLGGYCVAVLAHGIWNASTIFRSSRRFTSCSSQK